MKFHFFKTFICTLRFFFLPIIDLTGLDPTSIAGMATAAVTGEYPPPGAAGGPPEFLTGPSGQPPQAPSGGSPGEFLSPSGKKKFQREMLSSLPTLASQVHMAHDIRRIIPLDILTGFVTQSRSFAVFYTLVVSLYTYTYLYIYAFEIIYKLAR